MTTHHVIIGGGPAATNAIETIRLFESEPSRITVICDEPTHSRMALPYWLAGDIPREHTLTGNNTYFEKLNVDAQVNQRAVGLDAKARHVQLASGEKLPYDNLLIATGSSPVTPSIVGADLPGVQPLWSLAHTEQLLQTAQGLELPRAVLVGAGFIGFIVLNAMFKRGWQVTVIERETQVLPRMLDRESANIVEAWLKSQAVSVHCQASVREIRGTEKEKTITLADGDTVHADLVILATGIRPNVDWLSDSGLEIEAGILVDDKMQTSAEGVYAAGDVAQGPILCGEDRAIHAIQPTAVDHGRVAGANMAGGDVSYSGSLLMNVVDVCGLQCVSFGAWDDDAAEAMTISNPAGHVYRKLLWRGDRITGAIFVGLPRDLGMLTDVGMVKGILQTQTSFGPWKEYLRKNPFDIRRAYIAAGVPQRLAGSTLLGRPTVPRQFRYGNAKPDVKLGPAHGLFVNTKPQPPE